MIDVDTMGRAWGAAIRARLIPTDLDPVKHEHRRANGRVDSQGFAPASSIERIRELRDLAGSRTEQLSQFTEEGLRGDALLFHRCIFGAPLELRQTAAIRYTEDRGALKKTLKHLGWTIDTYYQQVAGLKYFVHARLMTLDVPNE